MSLSDPILRAVQAAIAEVNLVLPAEQALDPSPQAELLQNLDSLGVVNLILATESQVDQVVGRSVGLTDLLGHDAEKSPLRTVGGLVDFVRARLEAPGS